MDMTSEAQEALGKLAAKYGTGWESGGLWELNIGCLDHPGL